MNQLIKRSIAASITALGDAIVDVTVAQEISTSPVPGEDYKPAYSFSAAKGAFESVNYDDFPGTEVMIGDRTLLLLQFTVDINTHDWLLVGDTTYHVYGVQPDLVGTERVLQKLLVRMEPKEIAWESDGPEVVTV